MSLKSVYGIVIEKTWDKTASETYAHLYNKVWGKVWQELDNENWIQIRSDFSNNIQNQVRETFR